MESKRYKRGKRETHPYRDRPSSLRMTGAPIVIDGVPHSQKFRVTRHYKRGDDSDYDKPDGDIPLPLTLTHVEFEHNLRNKRSYQIVKGSSEFDGAIYPGLTSYTLKIGPLFIGKGERGK